MRETGRQPSLDRLACDFQTVTGGRMKAKPNSMRSRLSKPLSSIRIGVIRSETQFVPFGESPWAT
jgi:hypothetical protein